MHDGEDEVVICLEGELSYEVGDRGGVLHPGGLVWLPRQVPHAVANFAGAPCRFITVVTPGGIEDLFRAQRDYLSELNSQTPFDPDAFGRVPGSETRTIVGPPLR